MDAGNWVTIIVALIGLIGTIVTVALGNKKSEEKNAERQAASDRARDEKSKEQTDLIIYRIGELEKKQEKYNHLQERVAEREVHDAKYDERIAEMYDDVKQIKKKMFKE